MKHTLKILAGAALLTGASQGQTINQVGVTSALPLAYRAQHHLVLDVKWTVHDHNARGGAVVRVLRKEGFAGEPIFQVFAAVSGFWTPLPGDAALPMKHLAELSQPTLGQHAAGTRIYVHGARGVAFLGDNGFHATWPGVALPTGDFTDENVLEITTFGHGFSLDNAALRWTPSGTLFITR